MDRQHTLKALAGAAVSAVLLLPFTGDAAAPLQTPDPPPEPDIRQCFIEQPRWNEALDGPAPRCRPSGSA